MVSGNYTTIPFAFAAQKNFAVRNFTLSEIPPAARFDSSSSSTSPRSLSAAAIGGIVIVALALVAVLVLVFVLVEAWKKKKMERNADLRGVDYTQMKD